MGAYIVRKLLYGIAVLWGVATLVFFLFNILPGDPAQMMLGQRADEALENLQHFLDDAQLLSEKELRILHGKGYGILKQIIRDYLQGNRDVRSYRSERLELGGDGITVVQLK